jgi:hypothetical protein
VPRDAVSAIERGRIDEVRLAELDRVVAALGASLDLRIRWRGEQLDRLLDEAHALTVAATVERLTRLGWATAIEVLSNAAHGRSTTPIWRRERARRPSTPPGPAESSAPRPSPELDKKSIGEVEVRPPAAD